VLKPATAEFKAMQTTKTELREDEEKKGVSR
jgi:hypothetical protein